MAIRLSNNFNVSAPGANTDILASALTPKRAGGSWLRVAVRLATASVFNIMETVGGVTAGMKMNGAVALAAGGGYVFSWPTHAGGTYNFQVETDGVITKLVVEEVYSENI